MISNGVHIIIYIESFKHPSFLFNSIKKTLGKKKIEILIILSHIFIFVSLMRREGNRRFFLHRIQNISENENMYKYKTTLVFLFDRSFVCWFFHSVLIFFFSLTTRERMVSYWFLVKHMRNFIDDIPRTNFCLFWTLLECARMIDTLRQKSAYFIPFLSLSLWYANIISTL